MKITEISIKPGQWLSPCGETITVIGLASENDTRIGESDIVYQAYEDMSLLLHWNGDGTYFILSEWADEFGDRVFYTDEEGDRVAMLLDKFREVFNGARPSALDGGADDSDGGR